MKKDKYSSYEEKVVKHVEKLVCTKKKSNKKEVEKYSKVFAKNASKRKMISLRVEEGDLKGVKSIAAKEGLPYQTLINSIIHRYINGQLIAK